MRRAELACIAALALAGCMKIYPDPELPDLEVEWYEGDCTEEIGDVEIVVVGLDNAASGKQLTVPCTDHKAAFPDVARERYRVDATLLDTAGNRFNSAEYEVDMRNGLDETAYLYFGEPTNFRVAWTFDMGATCSSLGADVIVGIELATPAQPGFVVHSASCSFGAISASAPEGVFTVRLLAADLDGVVAVSPPSAELAFTRFGFTDVGTLVLSPCGTMCPEL